MKTKKLKSAGSKFFFLLLLFNFILFDAVAHGITLAADIGLRHGGKHGVIAENEKTAGSCTSQELYAENTNEIKNIIRIEYFFDVDPGFGNGIPIEFASGSEITIHKAIPLNSLDEGIHTFYLRIRDKAGSWSQTLNRIFLKTQLQSDDSYNITRVEYFFDSDPGIGNGTTAEFTLGNSVVLDNIWSENSLSDGIHMLYVRALDEFGQWSQTYHRLFLKTQLRSDLVNIQEAEYFFDADPGIGNGTKIEVLPAEQLTLEQIIPVEELGFGLHSFNIRCRFSNNNWGQLYSRGFIKYPAHDVVKVEYFFDDDPGYGKAIDLPITAAEMIIIDDVLPIQSLTSGNHTLNIRALSENDKWSEVFKASITVFGGVGIDEIKNEKAFVSVYPNPTNGKLNIEVKRIAGLLEIQLLSENGSLLTVHKFYEDALTTMDLSHLSDGAYILRFIYKDEVKTQNILLSR